MSIASEFDSTIENIKSDYEGLENIGADLTNIDKNIYNIRTCLDNIYDNLPKTTGEGSNLSLTTLKGRINVDDILGDTEQDTTTGKNVLQCRTDITIGQTGSSNGITWKRTGENTWLFNGTATADFTLIIGASTQLEAHIVNGQTYTLSGCPSGGSNTTYRLQIYNFGVSMYDYGSGATGVASLGANSNVAVRIFNGYTANNLTFNIQIEKGSSKTTFEPYTNGASPNPTYPQDINVVTGTQEVVVQNKNKLPSGESGTYTSSGATHTSNGKGVYTINGTATGTSFHNFQIAPYTIKSGDYLHLGNSVANGNVAIALLVSGSEQIMFRSCNAINVIQDLSSYAGKVVNYVRTFTNAQTLSNFEIKPMICNSSTQTDYVEHQEQTKTLHLSSSNLCNLNLNTTTIAGVTLTKNNDNTITANGTATSTIAVNILNNNGGTSTDNLTLPKGTYTLSGCPSGGGTNTNYKLDLVRNNGPLITDTGTSATYTATSDTAYSGIRIVIYSGTTCNNLIFKPMLNEGSTATTYEPYYNYELAKIGNYVDTIEYDVDEDKVYLNKPIRKKVLNGGNDENWAYETAYNRFGLTETINDYNITLRTTAICNYYRYGDASIDNYFALSSNGKLALFHAPTNISTLAEWKTWLSTNNLILYYILATATREEITGTLKDQVKALYNLHSFNGTTIIEIDGQLPLIIKVSALKGE